MSEIILGIDPGSRIMGYGLIESTPRGPRYVASGVIRVSHPSMSDRLLEIHQNLEEILNRYRPSQGAIEEVFVHHNVHSALKLGQARGVALVCMAKAGLSIAEYAPRAIKKSVVGYGGAEKSQVQQMVKMILNLDKQPPADAADALAIALCHFQINQYQKRLRGA